MSTPSTARFSDRALDYDAYRPSYPVAAIDALLDGLGEPARIRAADLGAGTGISSRLLAERGAHVLAIEPNDAMRQRGAAHQTRGTIEWIQATGEATGLESGSVDLVVCAQAFHWFDTQAALAEFRRILEPDGRAALLWNQQSADDLFTRGYRDLLNQHATEPPRSPSYAKAPPRPFENHDQWARTRILHFDYAQELDEAGLIGRAVSSSYCPNQGKGRRSVEEGLRELFIRFERGGSVPLRYQTELQVAHRA